MANAKLQVRTHNLVVRVTPAEYRLLERATRAATARTLSEWVRTVTLREAAALLAAVADASEAAQVERFRGRLVSSLAREQLQGAT